MDKTYKIFISSTYEDLKEARGKVRDAVLSMYHLPIGMEQFDASNEAQWAVIKKHIDMTDYYVLIIGHRFGSVIEEGADKGLSYTQKEFHYARDLGIPILAFFLSDNVGILPQFREPDWKVKSLRKFKDEVRQGRTVVWWETPDQLAIKATNSLYKEMTINKRPGYVRNIGNVEDTDADAAEEIVYTNINEIKILKPKCIEDSTDAINNLKKGYPVLINFEGVEMETAQRAVDMITGAAYFCGGCVRKFSTYNFIVTPPNVQTSDNIFEQLQQMGD